MKSSVSYAVAVILAGAALRAFAAAPAADPPPPSSNGTAGAAPAAATAADTTAAAAGGTNELATIIVTAQRRTENIQDVPISMQALTSQTMQQLNIQTFDDYVKYLPNVTAANNGPGQNEIFMRGVSAGSQASQGSGSTGLWPNVAVYLDDQSVQLPNRNLDIYAADLERIEVLGGRRARCSAPAPRPESSATSPTSRCSIRSRAASAPATERPPTARTTPT